MLHCFVVVAALSTPSGDSLKSGLDALDTNDFAKAVMYFSAAIDKNAKNFDAFVYRAVAYERQEKYALAVADLTVCAKLLPDAGKVYNARGALHFKLGKFKESLADFDKFLELEPAEKNGHWMRGITCYYAGSFDEGRKQFEGYENVDTNDVENAVWHYLCVARKDGVDKARASLLKIGNDKRVPMSQVYDLFAGKIKPADVLAAVKKANGSAEMENRHLFYAHLYLGLYHEVHGDAKKAREHLEQAVEHRIGHYMWDVARVHRDMLKK